MKRLISLGSLVGLVLLMTIGGVAAISSAAGGGKEYEVTITNLTRGQTFTPILVASHQEGVRLFELGAPVSDQLAILAEGGDTGPLDALLSARADVSDTATSGMLLEPGQSVTVTVEAGGKFDHFSVVSMLIPTNDAFFALNGVAGPKGNDTLMRFSPVYDAGSEMNDEDCDNSPGPVCGGEGFNAADGEGFVHIHAGIHGIEDLVAGDRDWRNQAAKITITQAGQ